MVGDKRRSAGAEKKMRSSDKCVFFVGFGFCCVFFFYIFSYECGSNMTMCNNNKHYVILFKLNLQKGKDERQKKEKNQATRCDGCSLLYSNRQIVK